MGTVVMLLVIFAIVIGGIFRGWRKGMFGQMSDLLAIIFGIVITRVSGDSLYEIAQKIFDTDAGFYYSEYLWSVVSRGFCFLMIFVVVKAVTMIFDRMLRTMSDGLMNKISGSILGLMKYALVISVVLNIYCGFHPQNILMKSAAHGDGNILHGVMLLGPFLLGGDDVDDLYHRYRLEDAKKFKTREGAV